MLLDIGCHNWPPILMGVACALAAYVGVKWARAEEPALPKWHWGDAHRRTKPNHDSMIDHVIGATIAALAAAYAVQNPLCG